MQYTRIAAIAATLAIGAFSATSLADNCCSCGNACQTSRLVKKTIMVPATVIETKFKSCLVYNTEQREETYTVFKRVPDERKIYKETCYLEDEVKSKKITETKCKRVTIPVTELCKTKVPVTEIVEGVRRRECCDECGNKVCVEEPCCCEVVREIDGLKSGCREEMQVVFEKTKRDFFYCVKTPKKNKEVVCEETAYKLVPVEKTRTVDVQVPEYIKKPYDVKVCKMIPKTIYCCETCAAHGHASSASPSHSHATPKQAVKAIKSHLSAKKPGLLKKAKGLFK